MPLTISNSTGDGVTDTLIRTSILLPDSGTAVQIEGMVQVPGQAAAAVAPNVVTSPAPPASGNIYWVIEVNLTTGVPTVLQSTSAMPAADAGAVIVFQQTLASGQTDPAMNATSTTPST